MPGTGTEAMSSVFPAILNSFSRFLLLLLLPPWRRTFLHRGQARGAISETLQRVHVPRPRCPLSTSTASLLSVDSASSPPGQREAVGAPGLYGLGNSQPCTSLVAGDQRPRGVYRSE